MNFDLRELRNAFGSFLTGVTIVTTVDKDGNPAGFTANSFTSVSLDPPLLLVCLAKNADCFDAFNETAGFAVNVLFKYPSRFSEYLLECPSTEVAITSMSITALYLNLSFS